MEAALARPLTPAVRAGSMLLLLDCVLNLPHVLGFKLAKKEDLGDWVVVGLLAVESKKKKKSEDLLESTCLLELALLTAYKLTFNLGVSVTLCIFYLDCLLSHHLLEESILVSLALVLAVFFSSEHHSVVCPNLRIKYHDSIRHVHRHTHPFHSRWIYQIYPQGYKRFQSITRGKQGKNRQRGPQL